MNNEKIIIKAKHKLTGKSQRFAFVSIAQAAHYNPDFTDWEVLK